MNKTESLTTLQDALIIGCDFLIRHGSIAPYTHGYFVISKYVKDGFCRSVTCSEHWLSAMPEVLYNYLTKAGWTDEDFQSLKTRVDAEWAKRNESYEKNIYKNDAYSHYTANGYEKDGLNQIVSSQCHGTWSNCTTTTQNDTAEELIILRGYCTDYYLDDRHKFHHIKPEDLYDILLRHENVKDVENWNLVKYMKDHPNRMYN